MKLYLALNEAGTQTDIGLHTKLAVLSALNHTKLEPHLLYVGEPNDFTQWLGNVGVNVISSKVPYYDTIKTLTEQNRYTMATLGHWLRTNVCLVEKDDSYVLYTDVDVIFRRQLDLDQLRPRYFMAAPEFFPDRWSYFNAGVMVANIPALRAEYPQFEKYLVESLIQYTYGFHDQIAYNVFYRGRWERLPIELNWKPYWGINDDALVVHFHGPKIGAISAMVEGRWNYSTDHGCQIGSLFNNHVESYIHYLASALQCATGLPQQDFDQISRLIEQMRSYDPTPNWGDLSFTDFRMFHDEQ
jgi:hypothetical protein